MSPENVSSKSESVRMIGRTILALMIGTVTLTVAVLALPVSMRYLKLRSAVNSSQLQQHPQPIDSDSSAGLDSTIEDTSGFETFLQNTLPGLSGHRPESQNFLDQSIDNRVIGSGLKAPLNDGMAQSPELTQSNRSQLNWEIHSGMVGNQEESGNLSAADRSPVVLAQAVMSASDGQSERLTAAESKSDQNVSEQKPSASSVPDSPPMEPTPQKTSPQSLAEARNKTVLAITRLLDSGFYAGYEAKYIWALNSESLGLSLKQPGQTQGMSISSHNPQGPGGRAWLGMQSADRGVRASYSFLNGKTTRFMDALQLSASTSRAIAQLELQTFDIELTQPFRLGVTDLELTVGARHLRYQSLNSLFIDAEPAKAFQAIGTAATTNQLSALGFIGGIYGRRPLPGSILQDMLPFLRDECDASGIWSRRSFFFWDARASALWGESKAAALSSVTVSWNDPNGIVGFAASRDHALAANGSESMLGTLELQIGIEHRRLLPQFNNTEIVFRGGLDFRQFSLGRTVATSESFAFLQDSDETIGLNLSAGARSQDRDLRLFGVSFIVGVNF